MPAQSRSGTAKIAQQLKESIALFDTAVIRPQSSTPCVPRVRYNSILPPTNATTEPTTFVRGMGLYDATMIVMGAMIGSGIFIVSADMARLLNSPGWLLAAWGLTGVLTIAAALCFGELAAMFPHAA